MYGEVVVRSIDSSAPALSGKIVTPLGPLHCNEHDPRARSIPATSSSLHAALGGPTLRVRRCRISAARPPLPGCLTHHWRVDDQVPERPDRGHIGAPEQSVWFDQDGHLGTEAARSFRDPADVHHRMDSPIRYLRRELVVEEVQRCEGERSEVGAGGGIAQIGGQPVAERRDPGAEAGFGTFPTDQLPELPPEREERANRPRGALRRVGRGDQLYEPREVVPAARSWQLPYVLEPEVARDLVDPPRPGGVRRVGEPECGGRESQRGLRTFEDRSKRSPRGMNGLVSSDCLAQRVRKVPPGVPN